MADFNNITSFVFDETQYDYSSDQEKVLTQGDLTLAVYDLLSTNPSFNKGFDYIFSCLCDNYDVYSSEYYTGVLDSSGGGEMGVVNLKNKNSLKLYEKMRQISPNIIQSDNVNILPDLNSELDSTQLVTCGDFVAPKDIYEYIPSFVSTDTPIYINIIDKDNIWKTGEFEKTMEDGIDFSGAICLDGDINKKLLTFKGFSGNGDYVLFNKTSYRFVVDTVKGCLLPKNEKVNLTLYNPVLRFAKYINGNEITTSNDVSMEFKEYDGTSIPDIYTDTIKNIRQCHINVPVKYKTPLTVFTINHSLVSSVDMSGFFAMFSFGTIHTTLKPLYSGISLSPVCRVGTSKLLTEWGKSSNKYMFLGIPVILTNGYSGYVTSDDYLTISDKFNRPTVPDRINITIDENSTDLVLFTRVEYYTNYAGTITNISGTIEIDCAGQSVLLIEADKNSSKSALVCYDSKIVFKLGKSSCYVNIYVDNDFEVYGFSKGSSDTLDKTVSVSSFFSYLNSSVTNHTLTIRING